MQRHRLLYRIGSWAFVLLGLGHLMTQWFAPKTVEQEAILEVMRNFAIRLPGSDGNLYLYHMGFSTTMGVLLMAYGFQALMVASVCEDHPKTAHRLFALHTCVAVGAALLSLKFFFAVPIVFMTVASVAFGVGFFLKPKA
jgi:hypothetical protein